MKGFDVSEMVLNLLVYLSKAYSTNDFTCSALDRSIGGGSSSFWPDVYLLRLNFGLSSPVKLVRGVVEVFECTKSVSI